MKVIAIVIALACISPGAFAEDEATPSPTPVFRNHLTRPGSPRRMEQASRQRALATSSQSQGQTRQQKKAERRSTAAVKAQERQAGRARKKAQREVAAQNRAESRNASPRPTSELMSRMGFSQQEIAAQKAREQTAKSGAKETPLSTPAPR